MNKKLLSLYGLKWNPFSSDVPIEGLVSTPQRQRLCWRLEHLSREGGFVLVSGDPGSGKSVTLRLLVEHLGRLPDLKVGVLTRPQSRSGDFYREMGDLFGLKLEPHNRWAGVKLLRERWREHIEASLFRPVLVVDEAQEMIPTILTELRLLCSTDLDSRMLLTVVLCGDSRLPEKFRSPELVALGSRIRVRFLIDHASRDELLACLHHALEQAGNPQLMTAELQNTLCEHSAGNYRVLMSMAGELLLAGLERDAHQLDEKLYLELFAVAPNGAGERRAASRATRR